MCPLYSYYLLLLDLMLCIALHVVVDASFTCSIHVRIRNVP